MLKVILVSIDVNNIAPNASLNADSLITVCFNLFLIGIFFNTGIRAAGSVDAIVAPNNKLGPGGNLNT